MTAATYGLERVDYTDELAAPLSSASAQPALAWARLVISAEPGRLILRTFVQCANRAAALAWAAVTPVHRLIAQRLVNGAAQRAGTR